MMISQQMHLMFYAIPVITQGMDCNLMFYRPRALMMLYVAKVSLDRINAFLHNVGPLSSPALYLTSNIFSPTDGASRRVRGGQARCRP